MIYKAYGGRMMVILILLAIFGVYRLFRTKQSDLILVLLGWMLYLPVYLLTFFRPGYFYMPFYVLYLVAILGMVELLQFLTNTVEAQCFGWAGIADRSRPCRQIRRSILHQRPAAGISLVWILGEQSPAYRSNASLVIYPDWRDPLPRQFFPHPAVPGGADRRRGSDHGPVQQFSS